MSDKWALVPVEPTEGMLEAAYWAAGDETGMPLVVRSNYAAMLSAVPPIPDSVFAEMVERGARAACQFAVRAGNCAGDPGPSEWSACPCYAVASACLRAALGIDRAAEGRS